MNFRSKTNGLTIRFQHAFYWFPRRARRLFLHVIQGVSWLTSAGKRGNAAYWWGEFFFFCLDLMAIPELYETVFDFTKWKTRPLTRMETDLARSVFGSSICYERVRIDETARIACRQHKLLYVSFYTINSWGKFHPAIFIHEMAHVRQFQAMGSVYISRALRAQWTGKGYNYGGIKTLHKVLKNGGSLSSFNLEQQADIMADYYAIREGGSPLWGEATQADLPVYEVFLSELKGQTLR